ncbi:MaoC/PaaZ C-terminal domain-containing protein [Nocardia sp. NPDC058518]|uniref:MaoC/PaaZ C-terminal domain-containing protein n=1 Tax=Nocardia sp. NPDC058518 TaxID=3346534 RepID=UPI00366259D8
MTNHDLTVGTALPILEIDRITRRTLALFAGASGDHQPVHIDIDAAKARGRDDVFAHGMLSMAYLGRYLTEWVPQERIRSYQARFTAITPLYAELVCSGRVVGIENGLATVELAITLRDGTTTVRGEAVVDVS